MAENKVLNQWIFKDGFGFQQLFECSDGWYLTTNGGFGQRDKSIVKVSEETALRMIKNLDN